MLKINKLIMKTLYFFMLISCLSFYSNSQSKKELQKQVYTLISEKQNLNDDIISLKNQLLDLKEELMNLKAENQSFKNSANSHPMGIVESSNNDARKNLISEGRCQAITNAGNQCSRKAEPNSNYCWQHKSTYEPSTTKQKSSASNIKSNNSTSSGRVIYTGSRGGKYYINSNGNKTYVKR